MTHIAHNKKSVFKSTNIVFTKLPDSATIVSHIVHQANVATPGGDILMPDKTN